MSGAPLTNENDDLKGRATAPKIRLRQLTPEEVKMSTNTGSDWTSMTYMGAESSGKFGPSMTLMGAESSGKSGPVRPFMSATRMAVQSSGKFGPTMIFEQNMQITNSKNIDNEAILAEIFSGAQEKK